MSDELKLPLPEPLRSIGKKWIDYAQEERDPNDIAFAIWSALHEAAQTAPVVPQAQEPVKAYTRAEVQRWRDDVAHAAADMVERALQSGGDWSWLVNGIRGLAKNSTAAPVSAANVPLIDAYRESNAFAQMDACDKPGALVGFAHACAAIRNTSQPVPQRDREADRNRFPDPLFNKWLDESISDAGHTVWDQINDAASAWAGWANRSMYSSYDRLRWQKLDFDYNDKDNIRTFHATAYDAGFAAAPSAPAAPSEDAKYPAVMLTRGPNEMCEVSLEIDGKWVVVLRDNGTLISHIVEPLGIKQAIAATAQQKEGE